MRTFCAHYSPKTTIWKWHRFENLWRNVVLYLTVPENFVLYFRSWPYWSKGITVTLHWWVLRVYNAFFQKTLRKLPRPGTISLLKWQSFNFGSTPFGIHERSSGWLELKVHTRWGTLLVRWQSFKQSVYVFHYMIYGVPAPHHGSIDWLIDWYGEWTFPWQDAHISISSMKGKQLNISRERVAQNWKRKSPQIFRRIKGDRAADNYPVQSSLARRVVLWWL